MHLRHRWETVEQIGHIATQACSRCYKTRVRIRASHAPRDQEAARG
ncbi:hypothetical protein [Nonomuraea cavernae]|nr:hypothetical protein [Nonomuraea cavernae]MCA2186466.1 hypothetical protein [Nonomuraea cavernae]